MGGQDQLEVSFGVGGIDLDDATVEIEREGRQSAEVKGQGTSQQRLDTICLTDPCAISDAMRTASSIGIASLSRRAANVSLRTRVESSVPLPKALAESLALFEERVVGLRL